MYCFVYWYGMCEDRCVPLPMYRFFLAFRTYQKPFKTPRFMKISLQFLYSRNSGILSIRADIDRYARYKPVGLCVSFSIWCRGMYSWYWTGLYWIENSDMDIGCGASAYPIGSAYTFPTIILQTLHLEIKNKLARCQRKA